MNLAVVLREIADARSERRDRTWRECCDRITNGLILNRPNGERAYWQSAYHDVCLRAEHDQYRVTHPSEWCSR